MKVKMTSRQYQALRLQGYKGRRITSHYRRGCCLNCGKLKWGTNDNNLLPLFCKFCGSFKIVKVEDAMMDGLIEWVKGGALVSDNWEFTRQLPLVRV